MTKIDELNSELTVCKKINRRLEEKVAIIHQAQTIPENYSRRKNTDMAGIHATEGTVIDFCK